MEVGYELICLVKTNAKGFCKDTTDNLTKYWQVGSYLMLNTKPMEPGDRPLLAISYKYNFQRVFYFITTYMSRKPEYGITYLSKYHINYANVSIQPLAHTQIMAKFSGYINTIEPHNKSRHSYLSWKKV